MMAVGRRRSTGTATGLWGWEGVKMGTECGVSGQGFGVRGGGGWGLGCRGWDFGGFILGLDWGLLFWGWVGGAGEWGLGLRVGVFGTDLGVTRMTGAAVVVVFDATIVCFRVEC